MNETQAVAFGSPSFSLARHRARTRPAIYSLPAEIFLEIFHILKDVSPPGRCKTIRIPDPRPNHTYGAGQHIHRREQLSGRLSQHCDMGWVVVTYVCSEWRQLALEHSSLWSSLDCTALTYPWVSEIITRAGSRPLDITLDFTDYLFLHLRKPTFYDSDNDYGDYDPEPHIIHLGGVAQIFLPRARQRSLFSLSQSPSTGFRRTRPLPSILPHLDINSIRTLDLTSTDIALALQSRDNSIQVDLIPLPGLETLTLASYDGHCEFPPNFLSTFAPRLKRLYLTQCSLAWNADLPHLTHLSIVYKSEAHLFPPNPCPTMDERVQFLTSMPLLEELALEEAVPFMLPSHRRSHFDRDMPSIVLPPTLKLLRLSGPRCIEDCIELAKRFDVPDTTRVDIALEGTQAVICMADLFTRYAGPARAPNVLRLSLTYDILDTYTPELQVSVLAETWHTDARDQPTSSTGPFHPPDAPALRLAIEGPQIYLVDRLNPCHGLCVAALTHLVLVAFDDIGPKILGMFARARNVRRIEVHESETGTALLKLLARAREAEKEKAEHALFPALDTLFLLEDRDGDDGMGGEEGVYDDGDGWRLGGERLALLGACLDARRAAGMPVKTLGLPRRHADAAWVRIIAEKVECVRFCG